MIFAKKFSASRIAVLFILLSSLYFSYENKFWNKGLIEWDVISYYAYVPAAFVYHDLTLEYIHDPNFKGTVWPEQAPNGKPVIKTTLGLAILYTPFFAMAHFISDLLPGYDHDGYSIIYSFFLLVSNIFYTFIGFYYLRKLLLQYFSESITTYVLLTFFFSTNLFYYSLYNVMAHSYLFTLVTLIVYFTIKWHEKPDVQKSIIIGLIIGLTVLIRPTHVLLSLFFIFYSVTDKKTLSEKVLFFLSHYRNTILIGIASFAVISLQLMYWKHVTGSWLFWSYSNERFFWTKPHIIEGLFGFRKGLFLYLPILLFSTIGLFLLKKRIKSMSFIVPALMILFTYVTFCWWSWWYGGGFSIRPMIDLYVFFALGLATLLSVISQFKNTLLKYAAILLIILSGCY
ncbi:MAG: hypothetical protein H7259_04910, partial [Cytophagales bacterium]|nr:hypothetical protein [Cytophaga sp.]